MTDYAPRSSQDYNVFYQNPHFAMSHYPGGSTDNMLYNSGHVPYPTAPSSYSAYSTAYLPGQNTNPSSMYMPTSSSMSIQYNIRPSGIQLPSQPLPTTHPSYYAPSLPTQRQSSSQHSYINTDLTGVMTDIESQESVNEASQLSEPVEKPEEGYPDVNQFDELMRRYVADLSPKKQDKALIHSRRAANIKAVLIDKKTTMVESAQFRFWVKKMFTLMPSDPKVPDRRKKICHEGKPVAIREKLFKILTKAHKACNHGGRDKTSAQVRRVYSWVPKELISRFVKLCPTCQMRRGTNRPSPSESIKSPETYLDVQSPETLSPLSQRESLNTKCDSITTSSPLQLSGFSTTFQQQNRWMTPLELPHERSGRLNSYDMLDRPSYGYDSRMPANHASRSANDSRRLHPAGDRDRISYSTTNNANTVTNMGYGSSNSRTMDTRYPLYHQYGAKNEPHFG